MATLKLPTAPETSVFRTLAGIIKRDPVISSCVKPSALRFWDGSSNDTVEPSFSMGPFLRFTPLGAPDDWKFPESFKTGFLVEVQMTVPGTDADDPMNLWHALKRAVYPSSYDGQMTIAQELTKAGMYTLPVFTQAAFDPRPADRVFVGTGHIQIDILSQLTG